MNIYHSYEVIPNVYGSDSMYRRLSHEMDFIISDAIKGSASVDSILDSLRDRTVEAEVSRAPKGSDYEYDIRMLVKANAGEIPHVNVDVIFDVCLEVCKDVIRIPILRPEKINEEPVWILCQNDDMTKYWSGFGELPIDYAGLE